MRAKMLKIMSVFICLCVAFGAVLLVRTELHGTSAPPILYYNDRMWSLSARYPAETDENGTYYIPLTVFVQLPSVDVRINDTLQTFIITHGDRYLSFDTATGYAANQDKVRTPIKTYERQGERYVPVEVVCLHLNLNFEKEVSPVDGQVALRITDGHYEYSLKTLLRRKNPGFYPENTDSAAVTPQTTASSSQPPTPTLTERTVYITIEDCPGKYTGEILDLLEEYNVKATFFVVGDNVKNDPAVLSQIAAGGHTVALHTMSHSQTELADAEAILRDIDRQNELIYRIIKQKSRVWRAPDGSSRLASLTAETLDVLAQNGYIVCDGNVNIPSTYRSSTATQTAINGIWANKSAVLRFCEGANTVAALRGVLDYIEENSDVIEVRCVSPAFMNDLAE